MDEDSIRALARRLGRKHRSGGTVIERAAILAEGADFDEVMEWIVAHGGRPEAAAPAVEKSGLHGSRVHGGGPETSRVPARFILPPDAFSRSDPAERPPAP